MFRIRETNLVPNIMGNCLPGLDGLERHFCTLFNEFQRTALPIGVWELNIGYNGDARTVMGRIFFLIRMQYVFQQIAKIVLLLNIFNWFWLALCFYP